MLAESKPNGSRNIHIMDTTCIMSMIHVKDKVVLSPDKVVDIFFKQFRLFRTYCL